MRSKQPIGIAVCAVMVWAAACGGNVTPNEDRISDAAVSDTSNPTCVPGAQIACACLGGGQGIQVCQQDGRGYDACRCPDGGTGGSGHGGGAQGGASGTAGSAGTPTVCVPGEEKTCDCVGGGVGSQVCNQEGTGYGACTGCETTDGLILWNRLGSDAELKNGVGAPGQIDGQVSFGTGKFGGAVRVGNGNGVTFTMGPWGQPKVWGQDEITIELWAMSSAAGQHDVFLYDFVLGCLPIEDCPWLRLGQFTSDTIQFIFPGSQTDALFTELVLPFPWDDEFHHFASTVSKVDVHAYIDGIEVAQAPLVGDQVLGKNIPYEIVLGQVWWKGGWAWSGYVDNIKVYDHAKTDFALTE